MLPSRERLTRSNLFQRAYTARKSISSPLVTLYVLPRNKPVGGKNVGAAFKHSENGAEMPTKAKAPGKMPLVGFVVAKKVCKSACARNRAKRRLREAYRHLRQSSLADPLSLSQWYAIVWVARDKALGATWQEVEQTVSECLSKANARYGAGSHSQRQADKSSPERQNAGRQPASAPGTPRENHDLKNSNSQRTNRTDRQIFSSNEKEPSGMDKPESKNSAGEDCKGS